jgi:hypothetical protein
MSTSSPSPAAKSRLPRRRKRRQPGSSGGNIGE